jgi:hypothetical protein
MVSKKDAKAQKAQKAEEQAQDARFKAFLTASDKDERDWIAFCQFEHAVGEVTHCAALVNPYDDSDRFEREREIMHAAVWTMMLRVLPRVGLGVTITHPEGLGYGLRYGIIPAKPDALDNVADMNAFDDLMGQAYEAEEANRKRREEEVLAKFDERERKAQRRREARRRTTPAAAKE